MVLIVWFLAFVALGDLLSYFVGLFVEYEWGSYPSLIVFLAMYGLYLSIVNVGQTFYSFGWESLLLEAGSTVGGWCRSIVFNRDFQLVREVNRRGAWTYRLLDRE